MSAPTCLRPECDAPPKQRGLCKRDYHVALRLVQAGDVSWDALEAAGKALPFVRTGPVSPAKRWLLDGTERDGVGKPVRDAVREAIADGLAPLAIWQRILAGSSSTGATKTIRNAAVRHAEEIGTVPACLCGVTYAEHALRAQCQGGYADPPRRPTGTQVDDDEDAVPPPQPPADTHGQILGLVRQGVPPREIMETLAVDRETVRRVHEDLAHRGQLGRCRCDMAYAHPGRCLIDKDARPALKMVGRRLTEQVVEQIADDIRHGKPVSRIATRAGVSRETVLRHLETMRRDAPLKVPDECECGSTFMHTGRCRGGLEVGT